METILDGIKQIKTIDERIAMYPDIGMLAKNQWIGDSFQRETLTPTGYPTIYTLAENGAGTQAMNTAQASFRLTTAATIGNDQDMRLSGIQLLGAFTSRNIMSIRNPAEVIDYWTRFKIGQTVTSEGFIGVMGAAAAQISALPTTAAHLGVYWDESVNNALTLSSADGTTQSTTDSTINTSSSAIISLHIRWDGADDGIVELVTNDGFTVSGTGHTYTAFNASRYAVPHWFVQTEAAAGKLIDLYGWMARLR